MAYVISVYGMQISRGNLVSSLLACLLASSSLFELKSLAVPLQDSVYETGRGGRGDIMTVEGAVQKTGLLMAVAMVMDTGLVICHLPTPG